MSSFDLLDRADIVIFPGPILVSTMQATPQASVVQHLRDEMEHRCLARINHADIAGFFNDLAQCIANHKERHI
jgi:hypothetical protein